MRARFAVPLVLVVTTLLAGAIGMQVAAGQTVLHLVLPADTQRVRASIRTGPVWAWAIGPRLAVR